MTIFAVIDIETTGLDPDEDAIVEIARVDVSSNGFVLGEVNESLIKPPMKIPPQASAVHHITDFDVTHMLPARDVIPPILPEKEAILIAHNAAFERSFLESYIPGAPWVCTYKAALRIWPEAPAHNVQTLRYFLNLPVERKYADHAHRAGPDAYVTAHLLRALLEKCSIDDMLRWTEEPALLPTCPIGNEWRGKPWPDVDEGFLKWIVKTIKDAPDTVWNAQRELDRRSGADQDKWFKMKRDLYVETACRLLRMALTIEDLKQWSKDEGDHRRVHKIEPGDDAYNTIAAAMKEHAEKLRAAQPMEKAA